MNAQKPLIVGLIAMCSVLLSWSGAWAWQAKIPGGWAYAMKVDSAGNVVAAGTANTVGTGYDLTAIKYDGVNGQELWRQVVKGSPDAYGFSGSASAVAIDASGNVVVAGGLLNADRHLDFTVIKFDGASGEELWRKLIINGSANALAIDSAGDVVAVGSSSSGFTVIKLSGVNGTELWRADIRGTASYFYFDAAYAIALDTAGNVLVAGVTENAGTGFDFTVVKFRGINGAELWRRSIDGTDYDICIDDYFCNEAAHAVAVDSVGNVVAAGITENAGSNDDFTVVKFDGATGGDLWRQVINGTRNGYDAATAVVVDAADNVITAGSIFNVNDYGALVVKFDGVTGQEHWRQGVNSIYGGSAWASGATLDSAGNVLIAGSSTLNSGTGSDFTVVKFDGGTGAEHWRQTISEAGFGAAYAIAVDGADNVVAAGSDFTVVKMAGTGTVLSVSPSSITAGANIKAMWSDILAPTAGDWIGLYVPGTPDSALVANSWIYPTCSQVKGGTGVESGSCSFQLPVSLAAGTYELRMFANHSLFRIARSGPFTVQALPPATLSASPSIVGAGTSVTATWSGIASPAAGDWIGLYVPGAADSVLVSSVWIYVSCSQVKGSSGVASGSCSFQIPASVAAGTYELRLFANNSLVRLGRSGTFTVQAAAPAQAATLSVTPASVTSGANVTAAWSDIPSPMAGDWIGLYVPGTSDSALMASTWIYVSCSQVRGGSGNVSGSCPFQIPSSLAAGTYELRMFANNSLMRLATSGTFTVQAAPPATLTASPSSVSAGTNVTVSWSGIASPTPGDWIGLYIPGSSDSALMASTWIYVSCSQVKGSSGVDSGSCPFQIPASLAAGTYELRLFANNSLVRLGRSNSFIVEADPYRSPVDWIY